MLEERHLVATTTDTARRDRFGRALRRRLEMNHHATVMDVTAWLDAAVTAARSQAEPDGLDAALDDVVRRIRESEDEVRHQYVIWPDVDGLLASDESAVRRAMHDAFAAAAEREFVSPDLLTIQRHVLLGGERTAAFAADPEGPARRWLEGDAAGPAFPDPSKFCPTPRVAVLPIVG